jgi:NAD(P)-dependent dehydrogenase (short-subunit alcohol dehydrogenase family)
MPSALAVVTGGSRGIGFEVCRQLARRGHRVLLTARQLPAAQEAARRLVSEELGVQGRALDVSSPDSIARFADDLLGQGEAVNVLVNNAGVSLHGFDAEVAARTLAVNYFGAAQLTDGVLPLVARGGRVVMVSSGMGELSAYGPDLRARFLAPDLDRAALDALVEEFIEDVRRGEHARKGWPSNAYRVSKAALNALVRLMAPALAQRGIAINAICPGWVRTAMGGPGAPRTPEQGAAGIVWAATLPPGGPSGGFFRDSRPISW